MNRRTFISGVLSSMLLSYQTRIFAADKTNTNNSKNMTGFIDDPVFLQHHIDAGHPESPERFRYIQTAMADSGLVKEIVPLQIKQDTEAWLNSVHTDDHIVSIKRHNPIAYHVATSGVGACLSAVDLINDNKIDNAFCATRPPGHHALNTGKEEGFCYFNNIAIAAKYAQKRYGLNKILIIDWDYHHGNATEAMFYDDPSVLFFSTHDFYAYPGTGHPDRKGSGAGEGYNINIHLPCGTTDEKIIDVFNKELLPVADSFKPDMVLVSAGF
ncbi:MAG: histone deacetylase, partial [Proteobacteria bacterium]|nr:histone deacetylase [Pseudomonadota bacterium]